MAWPVDASVVNTAVLLAIGGYVWRQGRKVDALYQSLYGAPGQPGALVAVAHLEGKLTTLVTAVATLNVTVELLTHALDERRTLLHRKPSTEGPTT